jgi:hypothetical protein
MIEKMVLLGILKIGLFINKPRKSKKAPRKMLFFVTGARYFAIIGLTTHKNVTRWTIGRTTYSLTFLFAIILSIIALSFRSLFTKL